MKKIKIQLNRPEPSANEIKAMQNFDQILTGVQIHKPWYTKSIWKIGGALSSIVTVVVLVALLDQSAPKESGESVIKEQAVPEQEVQPEVPLTPEEKPTIVLSEATALSAEKKYSRKPARIKASFDSYFISAEKGGEVVTKEKSFLRFSPAIFKNKNGKIATGKIEIRTREFHDALSIATSGITMAYDSAGKHHHLQSAGMIEIWALQGNDTLDLLPGKGYEVNLVSATADPSYNLYYLKAGENWQYLGKDKIYSSTNLMPEDYADDIQKKLPFGKNTSVAFEEVSQENILPPVLPEKKSKKRYRFDVDVNKKEFPEMAEFNGMFFEVLDDTNFTPAFYKIQWNDIAIIGQSENMSYTFRFSKTIKLLDKFPEIEYDKELYNSDKVYYRMINGRRGNSITTTFNAVPVFDQTDSAKVWKWYNDKLGKYQEKLAKRKQEEEDRLARSKEQERKDYERLQKLNPQLASNNLIYRSFTAMNMGVYNCDQIYRMAKRTTRPMFFKSEKGLLTQAQIKLVDKTANSVIGYYDNNITYNPDNDNMIVLILKDGRVAYVTTTEMKRWMSKPTEKIAETVVPETQFADSEEFRRALEKQ